MKKLKKIMLFILVFVSAVTSFSLLNVQAATAPKTIKVKPKSSLYYFSGDTDYISGYNFYRKQLTDGTLAYCVSNINKKVPAGKTLTSNGPLKDKGLEYIIKNGYPNKTFTGDNKKDYYITQSAIWLYFDQTKGSTNWKGTKFSASSTGMKKYVYDLVQEAKKAKDEKVEDPSITLIYLNKTLTLKGDYFVSDPIQVVLKNTKGTYTVTLTDAPAGTIIKSKSGEVKSTFNSEEQFVIYVPANSITSGQSGKVAFKVESEGLTYSIYSYSTTGSYQKLSPVVTYEEITKIATEVMEFTFSKDKTQVKISKQDITSKAELPGARLQVKDKNGKVVDEWVSTTEPHYIEGLEPGNYTLSETIAPEGYVLSQETITFTVKGDGSVTSVVMYNTKETKVTKVKISKQDMANKEELPGARLQIKDKNGKVVDEWVSTTEPHYIEGLEPGDYTLTETIAPEGYALSKETITFTVNADGSLTSVTMYNTKYTEVPITDLNVSSVTIIFAAILITLGTGMVVYYAKYAK